MSDCTPHSFYAITASIALHRNRSCGRMLRSLLVDDFDFVQVGLSSLSQCLALSYVDEVSLSKRWKAIKRAANRSSYADSIIESQADIDFAELVVFRPWFSVGDALGELQSHESLATLAVASLEQIDPWVAFVNDSKRILLIANVRGGMIIGGEGRSTAELINQDGWREHLSTLSEEQQL